MGHRDLVVRSCKGKLTNGGKSLLCLSLSLSLPRSETEDAAAAAVNFACGGGWEWSMMKVTELRRSVGRSGDSDSELLR